MSKESVQFVEMVREAAIRIKTGELHTRQLYCPIDGKETPHTISEQGLDEVYTCIGCHYKQVFRVR